MKIAKKSFPIVILVLMLILAACSGNDTMSSDSAAEPAAVASPSVEEADEAMAEDTVDDEEMADESMDDETMTDEEMAEEAMDEEAMDEETMEDEMMDEETMDEEAMAEESMNDEMADDSMEEESMDDEMADDSMEEESMDDEMAEDSMEEESMEDEAMDDEAEAPTFNLVQGWYEDSEVFYYDFGANTPATEDGESVFTAPIYAFITGFDDEGNPQFVEGQHNVVDVVPGDEGYSDLWEVVFVTVPTDYEANTITSLEAIQEAGYELTMPGVFVNCPIVPEGSELENPDDAPLVTGWYRDEKIVYFDFGPNPPSSAPIYAFVTGFDAEGNPEFVEGQQNVIGVVPGDEGYSDFWYVNLVIVPEDYEANSLTSVEEVLDAGYEMVQPGLLVNCPVVPA